MSRMIRFLRLCWRFRQLMSVHNFRALWIQSDPDWLKKMPQINVTDEEFDLLMKAAWDE